uniref:Uncharacterized protein n=1 Tax=Musa acuminata subsp. malaccensis TaxID=214687 RepID=A0A804K0X3_MUSAM
MIKDVRTQLGNIVFSFIPVGRLECSIIHFYDKYKSIAFICF